MKDREMNNNVQRPKLEIDWDAYGEMMEDSDMSEEDKRVLIETLWNIVVAFVDLGFDLHPEENDCGEPRSLSPFPIKDIVELSNRRKRKKRDSARSDDAQKGQGHE